MENSSL